MELVGILHEGCCLDAQAIIQVIFEKKVCDAYEVNGFSCKIFLGRGYLRTCFLEVLFQ